MGLVQGTERYLERGLACLRPGGTLHFHEICPRPGAIVSASKMVEFAAQQVDRHVNILDSRIIKSYSPKNDHVVLDVRVD
jgi:tRNA wybutosine-synthesizing protein 2